MKKLPKLILQAAKYDEYDGYAELEYTINGMTDSLVEPKRFLLQNHIVCIGDGFFKDYTVDLDGVILKGCTKDETIYQLVMNWLEACNSCNYQIGDVDLDTLMLKKE